MDLLERFFSQAAVVAETLDFDQTSVGLKADLPQTRQINQPLAAGEVARIIDGRFRAQRPPFFMVLLEARGLVIDVQGGRDAVGNHAGAEAARGGARDPARQR